MSRGALTWVEIFWNYNAKVIDYQTILLIKINKIINKHYTQIQICTWCIWKAIIESNLMKFIS